MKTVLTLALLCASLGGCAFVPVGYDANYAYRNGYYRGDYYRDRHYGQWRDNDNDRHRYWRDDDRSDRYYRGGNEYRGGPYYRNGGYFTWDKGQ
jgi:hypothetical protein